MSSTDDYKYNVHDISKGDSSLDTHRAKQPPSTHTDSSTSSSSSSSPRDKTADSPPIESLDLLDDVIAGGNTEEDFGIVGSLFADKAGNGKTHDKDKDSDVDKHAGEEGEKSAGKYAAKAKDKGIGSKLSAGKQNKASRKGQSAANGKSGSDDGSSSNRGDGSGGGGERDVKKDIEKKVADWTRQQQRDIAPQEKAEGQANIQRARQQGSAGEGAGKGPHGADDAGKGSPAVRDAGSTADSVSKPAVDAADQGLPQGDIKDDNAPKRAATDTVADAVAGARAAPSSDHHDDLTSNLGLKRVLSDKEKADKAEEIYDAMRLGRSDSHDGIEERERGDSRAGKGTGTGAGTGAQRTPHASRDQFPHSRSSSEDRGAGAGDKDASQSQKPPRTASRAPSREGENEGPEGAHDLEWARRREEMDAKNRKKMATEGLDLAKTGKGEPKLGKDVEDAAGTNERGNADADAGAAQKPASKTDAGQPAGSQGPATGAPKDVVPASKAAPGKPPATMAPSAATPRQPQQPPAKRGGDEKDKGKSKPTGAEAGAGAGVGKDKSAPGEKERKEPEQRKGEEASRGTPPRLQQVDLTNSDAKPSDIAPQKDATAQDTGVKPASAPAKAPTQTPTKAKDAASAPSGTSPSAAGGKKAKEGQDASEKAAANMPVGKVPSAPAGKQQQSQEPREGVLARAIHGLRDTLASGLGIGKSAPSQQKKSEKPAESGKSSTPRETSKSSSHPHPIPGTAGPAGGATAYIPAPDDLQSTLGALGMPLSPASRHHADTAAKGPVASKPQAKGKDAKPAAAPTASGDAGTGAGKEARSGKKEAPSSPTKDAKSAAGAASPQASKSSAAPTSPVATLPTAADSKKALTAKAPPSSSDKAGAPTAADGGGAGAGSRAGGGTGARGGGADEMKSERREAPSSGPAAPPTTGVKSKTAPSPAAPAASTSTSAPAPSAQASARGLPGLERIPELLSRIAGASGKPRASGKCDPEYLLSQQDSLFDKYGQAIDDNTLDVVPAEQQSLPSAIADTALRTGVDVGLLPSLATMPMLYHGLTGKTEHPQPLYGYGGEGTTRAAAPARTAVIAAPIATTTTVAAPATITAPATRLHDTSIRDRDAVRLVHAPAGAVAARPVVEQDKGILDRMAEAFKDLFSPQLSTEATNTPLRLVDEHGMHVLGADINTARIPPSPSSSSTSTAPSSMPLPSPSAPSPVPVDIDPYVLPTGEVIPIHTRPLLDMEKRDQILQHQHQYQQPRQWQHAPPQPPPSPASLQPRPIPVPAALVHEAIAPVQHTHARIDEEGRLVEVPVKRHNEPGYVDARGEAWRGREQAQDARQHDVMGAVTGTHAHVSHWGSRRDSIDSRDGWSRAEAEDFRRQGAGDDYARRERSVMLSGYDHVKQQPVWRREIEQEQEEEKEAIRRHSAERDDIARRYEQRQAQQNKQQQQQQKRYSTQYAPQSSDDYYTYVASAPTTSRVFTPRAAETPTPTPANTYRLATGTAPVPTPGATVITTAPPPPPRREGIFARLRDAIFGPPQPSPQQQQRDATAARMGMQPAPPSSSTAVGDGHAMYTRTRTDATAGAGVGMGAVAGVDVVTSGPHGYPMFRPQYAGVPANEQWHTQSGPSSDGKRGNMWVMTPEGWVDLATAESANFSFTHPVVMPYTSTGTSTAPIDTRMPSTRMQGQQAGRAKEVEVVPQRHTALEDRLMRLNERPQQRGWSDERTWARTSEDVAGKDKTHTPASTASSHPEDVYLNTSAFISREIGKVKGTNVHTERDARSDMQADTGIPIQEQLGSVPVLVDSSNGRDADSESASSVLGWGKGAGAARAGGVGVWREMRDSRRDEDSGACLHYTPTLR